MNQDLERLMERVAYLERQLAMSPAWSTRKASVLRMTEQVYKINHGFVKYQPLRYTGGAWVPALASNAANANGLFDGVVQSIVAPSLFTIAYSGVIEDDSSLTGEVFYVQDTAGAVGPTPGTHPIVALRRTDAGLLITPSQVPFEGIPLPNVLFPGTVNTWLHTPITTTQSGTFNAKTKFIRAMITAGGGGGQGGATGSPWYAGSAGVSGETIMIDAEVIPGSAWSAVIGPGGAAGAAGSDGSDGSDSTLAISRPGYDVSHPDAITATARAGFGGTMDGGGVYGTPAHGPSILADDHFLQIGLGQVQGQLGCVRRFAYTQVNLPPYVIATVTPYYTPGPYTPGVIGNLGTGYGKGGIGGANGGAGVAGGSGYIEFYEFSG